MVRQSNERKKETVKSEKESVGNRKREIKKYCITMIRKKNKREKVKKKVNKKESGVHEGGSR